MSLRQTFAANYLLLATNDNDFARSNVPGYPDYIFAFAVDPSDVPGFEAEVFAPEPGSLTLLESVR